MSVSVAFYFIAFFFQGTEVPYKPSEEFEIQVDYQFKQRPAANANTIEFAETHEEHNKKQYGGGIRPYLILNVKLLKLSDVEVKVRAVNNVDRAIISKKVRVGDLLKIDMGFTDDVKDRVGAYSIFIVFSSAEKKETSRIHLFVQENGTFLVNGEVRGKF